jgi:Domain of unknown function (DUF4129)
VVTAAHGPVPAVLAATAGGRPGDPGIGRKAAQRLARTELSKPEYHRHISLTQRIIEAAGVFISHLFRAASDVVPGGWWGLIALAALAVILAAGLLTWIGPVARTHRGSGPLTAEGEARTARQHRQVAGRLAGTGDYAAAIIECVRAIAAELEERGVLPPRAGRTADEFAAEAGQALIAHADALRDAARIFDEVCYGQRPGSRAAYQRLSELDRRITASAPRVSRSAAVGTTPATTGGLAS